ncbi:RNA polymerase sigma factor YlaC [Paraconexibacter sp. AEG42_29]|uniref:RNA polymerase sigma factor YlaC n=1 Tax=Paraconexibacter sp. AEG42_29 TaxID=2997339 RepID=A0AAU7AWB3_9ACTN
MQDADAFDAVYRRESEMVLLFLARRTLDPELALELTAETFAQAFRDRRSFRGSSAPEERAWLLTIARRQFAGFVRRGVVERKALASLGATVPQMHEDDLQEIEDRAGLAELRRTIGNELARLSGDQREALRLRVVEERSYDEVARTLGVSEPTARARVSRGLRALAQGLEHSSRSGA